MTVTPDHMSFNHTPVIPDDWEIVTRTLIVRLGPAWNWYENATHGSAGIVNVTVDIATRQIVVETDFDPSTEKILSAVANPDATLVLKGVMAGASGGGQITRYTLASSKALTGGYAAYLPIHPKGSCFDSDVDNLWITQTSMRPVAK